MIRSIRKLLSTIFFFLLLLTTASCRAQQRYFCEVLASQQFLPPLLFEIFAHMGPCPDEFLTLTESDVKATLGNDITRIVFNGFRQSLFDENLYEAAGDDEVTLDPTTTTIVQFGSLSFFKIGEIQVLGATSLYEASPVQRAVVPLWKQGSKVFELIAPNCSAVYTMQTVWVGGRNGEWGTRNITDLETTLDLDLPQGWTYQSRVLTEDRIVPLINGTAYVLTDSARNAYSKLVDFDPSICPGYVAPTNAPITVSPTTVAPVIISLEESSSSSSPTTSSTRTGKKQQRGKDKKKNSYFGTKKRKL